MLFDVNIRIRYIKHGHISATVKRFLCIGRCIMNIASLVCKCYLNVYIFVRFVRIYKLLEAAKYVIDLISEMISVEKAMYWP